MFGGGTVAATDNEGEGGRSSILVYAGILVQKVEVD